MDFSKKAHLTCFPGLETTTIWCIRGTYASTMSDTVVLPRKTVLGSSISAEKWFQLTPHLHLWLFTGYCQGILGNTLHHYLNLIRPLKRQRVHNKVNVAWELYKHVVSTVHIAAHWSQVSIQYLLSEAVWMSITRGSYLAFLVSDLRRAECVASRSMLHPRVACISVATMLITYYLSE